MEKKQTAVEWLEARAKEREQNNGNKSSYWHLKELFKDFEQAKEMENSQKKEMYVKGFKNYDPTYLNEIYGGNNSEVTISNNKHECCTPKGQVSRYVNCIGCDKKPIEGATLSYAEAQKDSFNIMEKKQTAVEWLIEKINKDLIHKSMGQIFEQAKQMEKEQIIGAANNGCKGRCMIDTSRDGKQYYNETYGGNNE
jgi:hypothetical protein